MATSVKKIKYDNSENVLVKYAENDTKGRKISTSLDSLQTQIYNLNSRGRFLALWNCTTGKPVTNPGALPFAYESGDYYVISEVTPSSGTNYKPSGSSYTGAASSTQDSSGPAINDAYYYDGNGGWSLIRSAVSAGFFTIDGTSLKIGSQSYDATLFGNQSRPKYTQYNSGSIISKPIALYEDLDSYAPKNHANAGDTYGLGTSTVYGHVKVVSGDLKGKTVANGMAASQSHTHSQYLNKEDDDTISGNLTISGNVIVSGTSGNPGYISISNNGSIKILNNDAIKADTYDMIVGTIAQNMKLLGTSDRPTYSKYNGQTEQQNQPIAFTSDIKVSVVDYTLED